LRTNALLCLITDLVSFSGVWPPSLLGAAFFFAIAQLPSLADIAV